MPKSYKTTTYTYDELPTDAAKKKAVDWARKSEDATFSDFHAGDISRMFYQRLSELGYPCNDPDDNKAKSRGDRDRNGTVEWSLSYSQGDGVAFYGPVDMEIVGKRVLTPEDQAAWKALSDAGDLRVQLTRNSFGHHYSHWNTMTVNVESNEGDSALIERIEEAVAEDVRKTSRELEADGYKEIEYKLSDATLIEGMQGNADEFYADGRPADTRHLTEET